MKLRKSRGASFGRTNIDFRHITKSSRWDKSFGISRRNYLAKPNKSSGRHFYSVRNQNTAPKPFSKT